MSRPRLRIRLMSEAALPSMPFLPQSTTMQADRGVGLHGDLGVVDAPGAHDLEPHPLDRRDDLVDPQAFEIVGVEIRGGKQKRETLEVVHGPARPRSCASLARLLLDSTPMTET